MKLILDPSKPLDFGGWIVLTGAAATVALLVIGIVDARPVLFFIGVLATCITATSVRRVPS